MSDKLIRVYKKFYIDEVKAHTLLYGALAGSCANCQCLDVKLDKLKCPSCGHDFKYIAFNNPRENMPKILRLLQEHPEVMIIDYEDFKKAEGELKIRDIFG